MTDTESQYAVIFQPIDTFTRIKPKKWNSKKAKAVPLQQIREFQLATREYGAPVAPWVYVGSSTHRLIVGIALGKRFRGKFRKLTARRNKGHSHE